MRLYCPQPALRWHILSPTRRRRLKLLRVCNSTTCPLYIHCRLSGAHSHHYRQANKLLILYTFTVIHKLTALGFFLCLLCWYAINTCHIWMHSRCVCVLTFDISAIYLSVCVLVVYFEEFIIITLPYGGVKCGFLKCESDWLIKKYTIVEYIHTLTLGINIFTMTSLFFFLITSYHVSYSFFILKDKVVLL